MSFLFARVPNVEAFDDSDSVEVSKGKAFWKRKHFIFAVVAQFFYMVAQTGIFSFFINYTV